MARSAPFALSPAGGVVAFATAGAAGPFVVPFATGAAPIWKLRVLADVFEVFCSTQASFSNISSSSSHTAVALVSSEHYRGILSRSTLAAELDGSSRESESDVNVLRIVHAVWQLAEVVFLCDVGGAKVLPLLQWLREHLIPPTDDALLGAVLARLRQPTASVNSQTALDVWDVATKLVVEGQPLDAAKLLTVLASVRRDAGLAQLASLLAAFPAYDAATATVASRSESSAYALGWRAWQRRALELSALVAAGGVWAAGSFEAAAAAALIGVMTGDSDARLPTIALSGSLVPDALGLTAGAAGEEMEGDGLLRPYGAWHYALLCKLLYCAPPSTLSFADVQRIFRDAAVPAVEVASAESNLLPVFSRILLGGDGAAEAAVLCVRAYGEAWAAAALWDLLWHCGHAGLHGPPAVWPQWGAAATRPHLLMELAAGLPALAPVHAPAHAVLVRQAVTYAAAAAPCALAGGGADGANDQLRLLTGFAPAAAPLAAALLLRLPLRSEAALHSALALAARCGLLSVAAHHPSLPAAAAAVAGDIGGLGAPGGVGDRLVALWVQQCLDDTAGTGCAAGRVTDALAWALRRPLAEAETPLCPVDPLLSRVASRCLDGLVLPAAVHCAGAFTADGPVAAVGGAAVQTARLLLSPLDDALAAAGAFGAIITLRSAFARSASSAAVAGHKGGSDEQLFEEALSAHASSAAGLAHVVRGNPVLQLLLAVRLTVEVIVLALGSCEGEKPAHQLALRAAAIVLGDALQAPGMPTAAAESSWPADTFLSDRSLGGSGAITPARRGILVRLLGAILSNAAGAPSNSTLPTLASQVFSSDTTTSGVGSKNASHALFAAHDAAWDAANF